MSGCDEEVRRMNAEDGPLELTQALFEFPLLVAPGEVRVRLVKPTSASARIIGGRVNASANRHRDRGRCA